MTHLMEIAIKQGRIKPDKVKEIQGKEDKRKVIKDKNLSKLSKQELIDIIESIL